MDNLEGFCKSEVAHAKLIKCLIWEGLGRYIGMNQVWISTQFFEASLNVRRCLGKFCLIFTLWLSSMSVGHLLMFMFMLTDYAGP